MTPDLEWAEWAPQEPPAEFAGTVARSVTLRQLGVEDWFPQRPDDDFALVATAEIVRMANRNTQRTSTGSRLVRTILGEAIHAGLMADREAAQDETRSLLVQMFLRWSQHDVRRAMRLASLSTSDPRAAGDLVREAVESATEAMTERRKTAPWVVTGEINGIEVSSRRRGITSGSQVRRFVRLSMERACGIARHFVLAEHEDRAVARQAFLYFVDSAMRAGRAAPKRSF